MLDGKAQQAVAVDGQRGQHLSADDGRHEGAGPHARRQHQRGRNIKHAGHAAQPGPAGPAHGELEIGCRHSPEQHHQRGEYGADGQRGEGGPQRVAQVAAQRGIRARLEGNDGAGQHGQRGKYGNPCMHR